jgi:phosphoserine phosphatase
MTAHALVFVASPEDKPAYREALLMLGRVALNRKLPPPEVLSGWESAQWIYESVDSELRQEAAAAVAEMPVDWALVPVEGRRKKLLVADMDSTIINVECLDELADFAGIKAEIAAITERAMRGELEFEPALRERVGKLKGLALDALQKTYDERVQLNPGAATFNEDDGGERRAVRCWCRVDLHSLRPGLRKRQAFTRTARMFCWMMAQR